MLFRGWLVPEQESISSKFLYQSMRFYIYAIVVLDKDLVVYIKFWKFNRGPKYVSKSF